MAWRISLEFCSGYSTRSTSLMAISPRVSVSSMSAPVAGSSATLETWAAMLVFRESFLSPTLATTSIL